MVPAVFSLLFLPLLGTLAATTVSHSLTPPPPNPTPVITQPPPPNLLSYVEPPYPALENGWNDSIGTQNLLGTRLYGWIGCDKSQITQISEAYDDFHVLANQANVKASIDWTDQAAKDYWGPSAGKNKLPDIVQNQIQYVFDFLSEVYPGRQPFISHWIKAKCSSPTETVGDPKDVCGDRKTRKTCPDGRKPSPNADDPRLETYSNNNMQDGDYDEIVFCGKFLSASTLDIEVSTGVGKRDLNIQNYDNRGRMFLHEMTHLDFFVDAPKVVPFITDVQIDLNINNKKETDSAYGALRAKILQNWRPNRGGFYTQRNADNYAWYAMTKYVWGKLGGKSEDYPHEPDTNGIKPLNTPRDRDGSRLAAVGSTDGDDSDPGPGANVTFPFHGMSEATFDAIWDNVVSCSQYNPFTSSSSAKQRRKWRA